MNNQQKQQVIEQVKLANNVLVTVSANPTVDELSASVGLTLALNKMGKHATTVFSGVVPSTIEFLQPEQTIETTTDSLRDFIIALDKSKADKLRYKVEDDVVRIFITPYKTTITDKDLQFSHGDFNVDVVVAIGVTRREDLDKAVTAHGRILHDAAVVSITRDSNSEFGSINWLEPQASSLCEMVAAMTLEIKEDVLDGQMSTAFLTGIIAETDRFKNEKTSPLALSLSSRLMSSGANQQLIAEKLEEPEAPPMPLHQADDDYVPADQEVSEDGTLSIAHNDDEDENKEEEVDKIHIDEHGNLGLHEGEPEPEYPPSTNDTYQSPHAEKLPEPSDDEAEDPNIEKPTLPQPDNNMPVMQHEHKVITPPSQEGKPKSDKPFDLNAAIQAANDEGIPVEAAPIEPEESEEPELPELPKPEEHETPKIIKDPDHHMLEGDGPKEETPQVEPEVEEKPSTEPPKPVDEPVEPVAEETPQPVVDEPVAPIVEEPVAPEPAPVEPVAAPAPIVDEQTLTQLEQAVDSPHAPDGGLDDARDAVAKAADSQEPAFPAPTASIGAQPVDLQKIAEEVATSVPDESTDSSTPEVTDPTAPPPVPPPMTTPQFFDQDGNNANPFLNPNNQ